MNWQRLDAFLSGPEGYEARMMPASQPQKQKGGPNQVMLVVSADHASAKQRAAAMDAQPDMQPAYEFKDDQDYGSHPPKEQQT